MSDFGMLAGAGALGQVFDVVGKASDRKYAQDMGKFNQKIWKQNQMFANEQALNMWNMTNASAQRKHLEDAGLSAGLMYGKGGAGGTTMGSAGAPSGNAGGAPNFMALGLQGAELQSRIKLNEGLAEKAKAEAERTSGTQTELDKANIESIGQGIAESEAKTKLIESQEAWQRLQNNIGNLTKNEAIAQAKANVDKTLAELDQLNVENAFLEGTLDDRQQIVANEAIQSGIQISLMEANKQLTQAQARKVAEETSILFKDYLVRKRALENAEAGQATREAELALKRSEYEVEKAFKENLTIQGYWGKVNDTADTILSILPTSIIKRIGGTGPKGSYQSVEKVTTGKSWR